MGEGVDDVSFSSLGTCSELGEREEGEAEREKVGERAREISSGISGH